MVGEEDKRLREQKGYTITELGRLADISKSYLSQLERGGQKNPSIQFLSKVSVALDTTIDFLLQGAEVQKHVDHELGDEWKGFIKIAVEEGM